MASICDYNENHFNVFEKHPEFEHYVDGTILSVGSKYRGCGIASKLMNGLLDLCKERNIPAVRVFASNNATSIICKKHDFENAFEIPYNQIVLDIEDPPTLNVPEPHNYLRIWVKYL